MSNFSENATCDEIILSTTYDAFASSICAALILFGLVYTFFGYRCFQAVMFLTGLIFGGSVTFLLCKDEKIFEQNVTFEMAIGIAAGVGVVCGFITLLVRYVGIFLQGFFLGTLLAFAGIFIMQIFYNPTTPWIPIGIVFVMGSIFAVATLASQKRFLIFSTAIFGSILITVSLDYFLENFYLMRYAWNSIMASAKRELCWFSWMLVGSWVLLTIFGIILQWKVTGKGFDHTDVLVGRRRKPVRTHLARRRTSQNTANSPADPNQVAERRVSTVASLHDLHPDEANCDPPPFEDVSDVDPNAPPPSYYECVELGIGASVADDLHSARSGGDENLHSDLVRQMQSGSGYSVDPLRRSLSERSLDLSQLRHSRSESTESRASRRPKSVVQLRPSREKKSKRSSGKRRHTRQPVQTTSDPSSSNRNDVQVLLTDASRARSGQGVVTAHAERLRAAENRRLSRQSSAR